MTFQPAHGLAHQLRRALQIPLRIGNVHMTEVGGQHRQVALRLFLAPIPSHQGSGSEPVSEVMQTRSVAVVLAAQADLARQRVEGTADLGTVEAVSQLETNRYGDTERPSQ